MISSLISGFKPGAARVLLVSGDRATLYAGRGGRLDEAWQFPVGEAGLAAFARYLASVPASPVAVLVDLVEEEYRLDSVPALALGDRRALLGRRFARQFRGTPWWLALDQGRDPDARRERRMLLAAITRPDLVSPWMSVLLAAEVPVSGLHSLPLVSAGLLAPLAASGSNVLLVTQQQASGLRQSFFRDGQLRISRLVPLARTGGDAAQLLAELHKLRRYLNSLGLPARDSPLDLYLLSQGEALRELEETCQPGEQERYHFIDLGPLSTRLGLAQPLTTPYADALFAQLLLRHPPAAQYALASETRGYRRHLLRLGLHASSLLLLGAATVVSGLEFYAATRDRAEGLAAAAQAAHFELRTAEARQALPPGTFDAGALRETVQLAGRLSALRQTPLPWLSVLGTALSETPGLRLETLEWSAGGEPAAPGGPVSPLGPERPVGGVARGRVEPFAGDYRAALATVDAYVARLRASPGVKSVEVLEYPLDLRPEAVVIASEPVPGQAPEARFALRLELEVQHAADVR